MRSPPWRQARFDPGIGGRKPTYALVAATEALSYGDVTGFSFSHSGLVDARALPSYRTETQGSGNVNHRFM